MGHSYSLIPHYVTEEFEKAKALYKGDKPRDYIVLDQVLQMSNANWASYPIDLTHLGTLFVINRDKSGRFVLHDFLDFAELCRQKDEEFSSDFVSQLQGYCSLRMWSVVADPKRGVNAFADWFCNIFSQNTVTEAATLQVESHKGIIFASFDTVKTCHQILNIGTSYGIGFHDFFALCRRAGDELLDKLHIDDEEELEEFVPLPVLRRFAESFIKGFINLMLELGFDPNMRDLEEEDYIIANSQ